ncbi:MAG TPA: XRE family transcriptional regulator [Solirubrobacterales bacterium]|nr:XRE family transcriptional regulator [Solirubrobacterales bacterium]
MIKTTEELSDATGPAADQGPDGASPRPQPMLGRRLKALRLSRNLSLKQLGAQTGLSSSFLSMVETGQNEMTVGRLVTLADFYNVGLTDLVPERDLGRPVVLRRDDRQTIDSPDRLVRTELLASWHHGQTTTGFQRFGVGAELSEVAPQPGPRFVLVLAGELKIEFAEDTTVVLREGDSVWFEGSRRHRHVNVGDREAHIITFRNEAGP